MIVDLKLLLCTNNISLLLNNADNGGYDCNSAADYSNVDVDTVDYSGNTAGG